MSALLVAGVITSLLANILLLAAVLGLARELGVLLARSGPPHAKASAHGPEVGTVIDAFSVVGIDGTQRHARPSKSTSNLLLFTSPTCPICQSLLPSLVVFAKAYKGVINTTVVGIKRTSDDNDVADYINRFKRHGMVFTVSQELHERLGVTMTPYAILLDNANTIRSIGIVNSLEHLESLVTVESHVDMRRELILSDSELSSQHA